MFLILPLKVFISLTKGLITPILLGLGTVGNPGKTVI